MLIQYIQLMDGIVEDAKLSLFDRADKIFKAYTHIETDILIGDILNNNGSIEVTGMLDDIYTFIDDGLDYVSSEIGIDFTESATIIQKIELLEIFKQIEDFEDSENLLRLMESELTPTMEMMLDVLSYVSGRDWTIFAETIDDVSSDTITAIYNIHNERVEKIENDKAIRQHTDLGRILKYVDKYPHTIINDGIRNKCFRPGLPLKPLIRDNIKTLIALYPDNPKQVAIDIIGLMLIANVPNNSLAQLGRQLTERIFKNTEFVSMVNSELNIISIEVSNE